MEMQPRSIVQRSRHALREGYSKGVRRFEIGSIAVYALVMAVLVVHLAPWVRRLPWLALAAVMVGFVAADFVSGVVHWAADTWGSPEWPIIGQALIRPFREHHVDPKEITRHDFIETNGNNCAISVPVGVAAVLLPQGPGLVFNFFAATFTGSLIVWVLLTNQFHKWSHLDAPPRVIALLQRMNLILPRDHHDVHHRAPYAKYYCITVGWMNEPLHRIRFFAALERIISALTGLVPREDDIGKRAALALVAEVPEGSAQAKSARIAVLPDR
jgi:ubiquitin-conjugating enzyme E2 variant